MKNFYVYILSSNRNGTLYTGVTSNLLKRIYEHKNNLVEGFTKKYNIHNLVWYEIHQTPEEAIARGKTDQNMETRMEAAVDRKNEP